MLSPALKVVQESKLTLYYVYRDVRGVTVIVVEYGHGDTSSNTRQRRLHLT